MQLKVSKLTITKRLIVMLLKGGQFAEEIVVIQKDFITAGDVRLQKLNTITYWNLKR